MRRTITTTSALTFVAALGIGSGAAWALFGPADLGPITFGTLQRRSTPNDALAAAPDLCPARSDLVPPEYAIDAAALRGLFAKAIASELRLEQVASDDATLTDRYVQRSAVLRFPDTVIVRFFDRLNGRSTLALYSRSLVGRSDFGVNRARIERWLAKLAALAPAA